ncbi:MAG: glycine--tRNA ligase [Candidatus Peribacter sp.]|jgi:glycyl-tRNA synthetase|nr:glycine--tRNA ligase [Candidatus Peribacter sp.]MBT4392873.1 glycine--tRNA ligase [Candidatus Peribacter sp.]MBT4601357.1 glycine--tRNA ligase [Candidatus Peribacter sp.]MBT5149391.1 glycine--tRNA ligase [Candidatus Peribacter sp.]MBT5637524.1 glycine--tRNA ligase [Candidatus Peribacter sp.]
MPATSLDQVVSLCKRRGFIFPGSDIYGGLANTWDYGPLGVELKNRVKQNWWTTFVHNRPDMVGLDSGILMNPRVWEASGHVGSFADPLVDCKSCKERYRGDKLLEEKLGVEAAAVLTLDQVQPMLAAEKINCPKCGNNDWSEAKHFNLMFKTQQGVVEGEGDDIYMRPETAQGIFVNFKNVLTTSRMRLPFGIGQIGKAFRNEITPGNFTFRTREFEQMEIEYFVEPDDKQEAFDLWKKAVWSWYEGLGVDTSRMRFRDHDKDELSHYSSQTVDIEYQFPWGWGELFGLADRGDYDLSQHEKFSSQELKYTDPDDATRKFVPHVIEPSFGCDRSVLTYLIEAYTEEELENGDVRTVMKFDKRLSPIDIAILPLSKKEHLVAKAKEIHQLLLDQTNLVTDFDVTGSIGKRYRRQDEIGTPLCITVDFGTIGEDAEQGDPDTVTIRDRDTLEQKRVKISDLRAEIAEYWKN